MGIKYGREYAEIIGELASALAQIDQMYTFFEMPEQIWLGMNADDRKECIRTMADDIFYGLGVEPMLRVGCGTVSHDAEKHVLKVSDGDRLVSIIYLA